MEGGGAGACASAVACPPARLPDRVHTKGPMALAANSLRLLGAAGAGSDGWQGTTAARRPSARSIRAEGWIRGRCTSADALAVGASSGRAPGQAALRCGGPASVARAARAALNRRRDDAPRSRRAAGSGHGGQLQAVGGAVGRDLEARLAASMRSRLGGPSGGDGREHPPRKDGRNDAAGRGEPNANPARPRSLLPPAAQRPGLFASEGPSAAARGRNNAQSLVCNCAVGCNRAQGCSRCRPTAGHAD
jgi:hypothetical protein